MPSKGIIVLGMHRSGTSMLAGLLHLHGAYVGRSIGYRFDNPKGFWEHRDVMEMNIHILNCFGLSWDLPFFMPPGWQTRISDLEKARDQIIEEFLKHELWVLKEPRLCHLFPWWRDAFLAQGAEIFLIVALRHPVAVAKSLEKRDMPREQALLAWCRHIIAAEEGSRGLPRIIIDYNALLKTPQEGITRIAKFFGLPLHEPEQDALNSFVEPSLRHHDPDKEKHPQSAGLEKFCLDFYASLNRPGVSHKNDSARLLAACEEAKKIL
jgi:hypothetical protein